MKAPTLDENGKESRNKLGVPQGSIVSPVLANLYLHKVIDLWFAEVNKEHFGGKAGLVRYADDGIFTFKNAKDAEVFQAMLKDRLSESGIALNLDKTKIVACGQQEAIRCVAANLPSPGFTFLGFLHVWGKSVNRKTGKVFWRVKRRTCPKRFRKKLAEMKGDIAKHRHEKNLIPRIITVVKGYLNYFAINDNARRVSQFLQEVKKMLFKYLNRRSQKRSMNWQKFISILNKLGFPRKITLKNLFFNLSSPAIKAGVGG
jgi:hypothetical protein